MPKDFSKLALEMHKKFKGKIETRVYENMLKSYSSRLTEVEEQITFLEAQEALNRNKFSFKLLKVIGVGK